MIIHFPKMPLGSRISPPASQHPRTPCMKEHRLSCSGRILSQASLAKAILLGLRRKNSLLSFVDPHTQFRI